MAQYTIRSIPTLPETHKKHFGYHHDLRRYTIDSVDSEGSVDFGGPLYGLDTPHVLMYLFRRFGHSTWEFDDFKNLFCYYLEYGPIVVEVWASYHQHVMFEVHPSDALIDGIVEEWKHRIRARAERYFDLCMEARVADVGLVLSLDEGSDKFNMAVGAYHEFARATLEGHELDIFLAGREDDDYNRVFSHVIEQADTAWEGDISRIREQIGPIPEVDWASCDGLIESIDGFVEEMRKFTYVRDVYFNIFGYPSDTNPILYGEEDEHGNTIPGTSNCTDYYFPSNDTPSIVDRADMASSLGLRWEFHENDFDGYYNAYFNGDYSQFFKAYPSGETWYKQGDYQRIQLGFAPPKGESSAEDFLLGVERFIAGYWEKKWIEAITSDPDTYDQGSFGMFGGL